VTADRGDEEATAAVAPTAARAVRAEDGRAPESGQPASTRERCPKLPTPRPRVFYRIDSRAVSLREYWWSHPASIFVAALLKLLRVRVPSSTDDPNVESLAPFETEAGSMPEDVREQFAPLAQELEASGFHSPIHHVIEDDLHHFETCLVTFAHDSGQAWARLHRRRWTLQTPPKEVLFTEFVTPFRDGSFVWSLSSRPDMLSPKSCRIVRKTGASPAELWAAHEAAVEKEAAKREVVPLGTSDAVRASIERHHGVVRNFHLRRGVFAPLTRADRDAAAANSAGRKAAEVRGSKHPQVMAEIQRLQARKSSGLTGILVLLVSAALFLGAFSTGSAPLSLDHLAILIPVLLFHEAGHWLAMRTFGYRNLRMFFIPFFGAAVSGRHYNVPAWKKAVVSLMGPLPGIVGGAILGSAGLVLGKPLLLQIAMTALILNGLNLLPILPLDGGWVVQAILASRSVLFEVVFRVLALGALFALGFFLHDTPLLVLGGLMLVTLPAAYKLARITRDLRQAGLEPLSPDDETIPAATSEAIVTRVAEAFPQRTPTRKIAEHTLSVFEALNARPPGVLASLSLAFVQGTGLVAAVVFTVLVTVGQQANLGKLMEAASALPATPLDTGTIAVWRAPESDRLIDAPHNVVVATFETADRAREARLAVERRALAGSATATFGHTLLLALPTSDDAGRKEWLAAFQGQTKDLFVATPQTPANAQLSCVATSESSATAIEQEAGDYFLGRGMHLIPPWIEPDARTPEERLAHARARRTYGRLVRSSVDVFADPRLAELPGKMLAARQAGDIAESTRLQAEQERVAAEVRRAQIEKLLAGPDVDATVVERYRALVPETHRPYELANLAEMGPLLGQLAIRDGSPEPRSNAFRASGFLGRNGLLVSMPYLRFESAFAGPPAMVRWLQASGCTDFRYGFTLGSEIEDEDEEEDPTS
jgi:Zn-dependent protease